jgi:hypothetical protein
MLRRALRRRFRAAPAEAFITAVVVCLLTALFRTDAQAQFLPSGCPGQWVQGGGGMMCQCADGSYASMVGNQIVCNSHQSQRQNVVGDYCDNGGTCGVGFKCSWMPGKCAPEGKVDCGEYFCQPGQTCSSDTTYHHCLADGEVDCGSYHCSAGYKCSSAKCILESAVDCENGRFCNAGYVCGSNDTCNFERGVVCGTRRCEEGYECTSGNSCIPAANTACGAGSDLSCPPGSRCSGDGKRCLIENAGDNGRSAKPLDAEAFRRTTVTPTAVDGQEAQTTAPPGGVVAEPQYRDEGLSRGAASISAPKVDEPAGSSIAYPVALGAALVGILALIWRRYSGQIRTFAAARAWEPSFKPRSTAPSKPVGVRPESLRGSEHKVSLPKSAAAMRAVDADGNRPAEELHTDDSALSPGRARNPTSPQDDPDVASEVSGDRGEVLSLASVIRARIAASETKGRRAEPDLSAKSDVSSDRAFSGREAGEETTSTSTRAAPAASVPHSTKPAAAAETSELIPGAQKVPFALPADQPVAKSAARQMTPHAIPGIQETTTVLGKEPTTMEYKAVGFDPPVTREGPTQSAAIWLNSLIAQHASLGWEFMGVQNHSTIVPGSNGCFGFGKTPPYPRTVSIAVFRRPR